MIEVWYFADCPNHEGLVPHLRALLDSVGVDEPIHERVVETDEEARTHRFLGSPTLRIDGVDVDPTAAQRTGYGLQCRLYQAEDGLRGTPPDTWILAALQQPGRGSAAG
ncbi:hypothetical protein ONA70_17795 [Micromonospora yasonensis]|uniref:DF family (seleno)protein n=1 Tax=Micromonospora yasonensis TaxID=1128667 RepID=UPI00222F2E58|nr:hypothetical protein [Micromonospora yasonensis]MCW3841955.1 hypothetical protein [Micromonospora yasonensis]